MCLFFSTGSLLSASVQADAYAETVGDLAGLVAYWRMADADPALLADASGNGHSGFYVGTPSLQVAGLTESWQSSDGVACDCNGAGWGTVPHASASALAQGSLSFWFSIGSTDEQYLITKRSTGTPTNHLALRVRADGALEASFETDGTPAVTIASIAGVVSAGERHHCVVGWSEKIVRLWLDGRQVAKSTAHRSGLVGNTSPWRFGAAAAEIAQDVVLDEVALYHKTLQFAEVQALSQFVAGLGYRAEDAVRTVNVGDASELANALAAAQPGDQIILADGTYVANFSANVSGTRADRILVRSANGPDAVTIEGDFDLDGDWIVLAGVGFADGGHPEIHGQHCRVTRCKNVNFTDQGAVFRPGGHWGRIDHCLLGPPAADSGGGTFTNQPLRVRADGTSPSQVAMYALSDHLHLLGAESELGNGRDVYAVGNTSAADSYAVLHNSILQQSLHDEGISLKSSSAFVQFCTFRDLIYVQNRHGAECEWRSNYYQGCEQNDFGFGHWHIGNTYDASGNDLRLGPGDVDQATFETSGGARPASAQATIIGCTFLNGAKVDAGNPDWETGVAASGATAEGNSGWNVTYTANYVGTIAHEPTTNEPFQVAARLADADVGPLAPDPLVPPGWA